MMLGVKVEVWAIAAKKAGKWDRRVLEAAERFMDKWHENEATLSRNRHSSAIGGAQRNRNRGGVTVAGTPWMTKAGRKWHNIG